MTIRFECPECGAVLKIRPERAGQQGQCPACKSAFTIPAASTTGEPALTEDDLVDMPLEVTPLPVIPDQPATTSDEFDPMGVLNSDSATAGGGAATARNEAKPSVAELMKEHQQKRSRDEIRRARRQQKKLNPLLSEIETSGSAADAITRSYEKKRGAASDAPILSREQRRAAAARASLIRFALQLTGSLLMFGIVAYFVLSYALSGEGTDLVQVTGRVTVAGEPAMSGYTIRFTPIQPRNGPKLTGGPSFAKIDSNGEFRLRYDAQTMGAVVATHEVTIEDGFGLPQPIPEGFSPREVTADGENRFEFNF